MSDQTLEAFDEVHGQKKPDDVGLGEWMWGAVQGDFNEDRSVGQIGFDMGISLIPVVDTVCDLRDLCANIQLYRKDPTNKIAIFFLATTAIGFFPEIGTVAKSALRVVWVYLRPLIKHADDLTNASKLTAAATRAVDAAIPKITDYLQHNSVAKWATKNKIPDLYKFVAKQLRDVADKINAATLKKAFYDGVDGLKQFLQKIRNIVPSTIRERIDDFVKMLDDMRLKVGKGISDFVEPIRTILRVTAKRLDDHAWQAYTYQTNRGWIAPLSESGAAKLVNGKPPKWVTKGSRLPYPPFNVDKSQLEMLNRSNPLHPPLTEGTAKTFSKVGGVTADAIKGPAKLYRVIDPSNEGAGIFWMTEREFKELSSRDEWRKRFAVKPDWNQNGWYVTYEVAENEELKVWRGRAASQKLEGTDYHLEGGHEQIVFYPGSRDTMVQAQPRIDSNTGETIKDWSGNPDRRVEFTDITGETVPSKLRAGITDPHIKGPTETGWGATDYTPQEAKRILLTVPAP
jgi:hypothetical protein